MIPSDLDNILALNNAHKAETSALTRDELIHLLATAFHSATEGGGKDGFLIAFDQDADYASPNFHWFKPHRARFVYIDRVIVAPHARGRGLARVFYGGLIARARAAGHDHIVCEVNLDPPNPGSLAFHATMGFVAVGEALLPNGKTVRYMELGL